MGTGNRGLRQEELRRNLQTLKHNKETTIAIAIAIAIKSLG